MTTDADRAHWGIAAYSLSLDLGAELASLALPDAPWDVLRPAIRDAILWNRQTVEANHPPLYLRDAIGHVLQQRAITPPLTFLTWVETRLVTAGRTANGAAPLLAPLRDPRLLAEVDAVLAAPPSYAALVHAAIDPAASDTLLEAVFAADGQIDLKNLSPWDVALIARNADHHAPDNPLAPLIHTLTLGLAMAAADHVAGSLDTARADTLRRLCTQGPGA
jgi:hypothetical protein